MQNLNSIELQFLFEFKVVCNLPTHSSYITKVDFRCDARVQINRSNVQVQK